jgi:hypothetical protein
LQLKPYSRVSTVDEIKKAAGALSVNEREELLSWLLDVDDEWDWQMAKDAASGKLDFLIEEARTAVREESLRDWPTNVTASGNRIRSIVRFDSNNWKIIRRFIPRVSEFITARSRSAKAIS